MKHRNHFRNKQFSVGQYGEFAWPTWTWVKSSTPWKSMDLFKWLDIASEILPNNSKYVTTSVALFGTYFLKSSWKWQYSLKRKLPGCIQCHIHSRTFGLKLATLVHVIFHLRGYSLHTNTPFQNGITNYIYCQRVFLFWKIMFCSPPTTLCTIVISDLRFPVIKSLSMQCFSGSSKKCKFHYKMLHQSYYANISVKQCKIPSFNCTRFIKHQQPCDPLAD